MSITPHSIENFLSGAYAELMTFSLRKLEYFVEVAELGKFTAAAASLHVSQTAISIAIADLERQLGVELFVRHRSKGIALTRAGGELLPHARAMLEQAAGIQSLVARVAGEAREEFTLGSFGPLAPFLAPEIVYEFARADPPVDIRIDESDQMELQEDLLSGRKELGVMYDVGVPPGLIKSVLYSAIPRIVVADDHRFAGQASVSLEELSSERLIMLDVYPSKEYLTGLLEEAGVHPLVGNSSRQCDMVREYVRRGLGYAFEVHSARHSDTGSSGFVSVPLVEEVPPLDVVLVKGSARGLSSTARRVSRQLQQRFASKACA